MNNETERRQVCVAVRHDGITIMKEDKFVWQLDMIHTFNYRISQ